jgi:signal transduction histidine kinase
VKATLQNHGATETSAARGRILVVDDHAVNCELLEAILAPHGYLVEQAYSGPDAVAHARKNPPDLVLLDVNMPGMDGFQVARELRSRPDTRMVPIVMVTALGDLEHRVRGLESGADDYLAKPVNRHELLARVQTSLRLSFFRREVDERQKLDLVLADVSDGVVIVDAKAVVRECNHAARRLLGLAPETTGAALASVWGDLKGAPSGLVAAVRDGHELEFLLEREDPPLFIAAALRSVLGPDGAPTGAVLSLRDVTRETLEHKLQQDVLSLVSHKFRTPLTVVGLWTKLLLDGECGPLTKEQREALVAMQGASDSLRQLLEGMISYLEWTKRLRALHRGRVTFAELETTLRDRVQEFIGADQTLTIERDGGGELHVDPALFVEVLVELVRNATKFGGERVKVRVEMRARGKERVVSVSDDGPGIPPEQAERIFERFYQVETDFTGQVHGFGLGLSLAKTAVEAHGGKLRVHSKLEKGTRFEITL